MIIDTFVYQDGFLYFHEFLLAASSINFGPYLLLISVFEQLQDVLYLDVSGCFS